MSSYIRYSGSVEVEMMKFEKFCCYVHVCRKNSRSCLGTDFLFLSFTCSPTSLLLISAFGGGQAKQSGGTPSFGGGGG